ncbi:MAG: hypothetical protein JJU28_10295 [Cyclobacteriaceae bacterium]|nr:hypothetical protein [Cyclobacteriaceae bacterium]
MKYFFQVLMVIHGAIHALGFIKGFQWAEIDNLSSPISKTSGIFWLLALVMFVLSALLLWRNNNYLWMLLAGMAVFISTILILQHWDDAKFGMIANVIIAMGIIISFSGYVFNQQIVKEKEKILKEVSNANQEQLKQDELIHLPKAIQKWLLNSGAVGQPKPNTVWLRQKFNMKLKPEQGNWYMAVAEQCFTTEKPAFIWTVQLNMSPFIQIKGRDKFENGKGEMQMKMNNLISLGKETGEKMDEGTLQRFLGEMVWFPSFALSPYVQWEEMDELTAKATMTYKGTSGSGVFHFNNQGELVNFTAWRYKGNDPDAKRYEWVITAEEHALFNGIKIPSKCSATWKLDEGDWNWCVLEITELEYDKATL